MYINTHTYYSLRYGTLKPRDLLEIAQVNDIQTCALTDINNTSACLDFVRLATELNIKPVLGVDFREGACQKFILLAKNNQGFFAINNYLSELWEQNEWNVPDDAIFLEHTFVVYPWAGNETRELRENEYLGVKPQDLKRLIFSPWKHKQEKLVILHTVSFDSKKSFNTHRLLRAIDNNTLLSKLPKSEQGSQGHVMVSQLELELMYSDLPELIKNTKYVLSECTVEFDFTETKSANQKVYTTNESLDFRLMRKLAYDGLAYRYPKPDEAVYSRIEKELSIIKEKNFVSYFLINWKILKYARSKDYYYVGRGSGANSIVAYLLRITDVDPIELDLYFERFINLYRQNPPDFDIDFSWTDRDDITNYIFCHFKNTALLCVYNTFQYKASVRELGKVFGLPKHEIDKLTKGQFDLGSIDELSRLVGVYAQLIEGFPNYLSVHACGIVITEKPVQYYCATFMPPKGYTTTQIDMAVAEDVGMYKFDILSQRGLGKIKDSVKLVKENHGLDLDIHDIKRFKEDEKIKHLLRNAKAIGCFYVESPAMRMLLKKLQVDHYLGLVAASSVISPGVAKSGMMRQYILRFRYPEKRKGINPILLSIMPETFGVMVYQEDVIKVAHYFGGLSLGESDMLRRGMSGKFRSREEFAKVKNQFFENCSQKGHTISLTTEIWRQIESFAGYAFAKGHSASYAVESYQSLFLKAYYPLEYMVATLNNSGGFYHREFYVHEARMNGGIIHAPCINRSRDTTSIEGSHLYLGFHMVKTLESTTASKIINERVQRGNFRDLDDFIDRVSISLEQLTLLVKVDAFRFIGKNKRELLWESYMKVNKIPIEETVISLFKTEKVSYNTPKLDLYPLEEVFDQMEYLGFPLKSPFDLLLEPLKTTLLTKHLYKLIKRRVIIAAYLVTVKYTVTNNGLRMYFGTFVDQEGEFIDTVHFPQVAKKYPFRGSGVYLITGKVVEEFDCLSIEVDAMERLAIIEDPRYAEPKRRMLG